MDFVGPARIPYGELKGEGKGKELPDETLRRLFNKGWKAVKIGHHRWVTMEIGQIIDRAINIRTVQKEHGNLIAIPLETKSEAHAIEDEEEKK